MDHIWLERKPSVMLTEDQFQSIFRTDQAFIYGIEAVACPLFSSKVWASFVEIPPCRVTGIHDRRKGHDLIGIAHGDDVMAAAQVDDLCGQRWPGRRHDDGARPPRRDRFCLNIRVSGHLRGPHPGPF